MPFNDVLWSFAPIELSSNDLASVELILILTTLLLAVLAQIAPVTPPPMSAEEFVGDSAEVVETGTDRADRMTVPVTIAGQGPYQFFVDTGSQSTVLSQELGDQLDLPSDGNATLVSVAERTQVELVQLDGLELGSRVIDGLRAPLLNRRALGADGIIGIDSLQDLRVLIDFRENLLAIVESEQPDRADGFEIVVRARTKLGRLIVTNAEIDGIDTVVIVDTGAQASIGNLSLQRRLRSKKGDQFSGEDVVGAHFNANFGKTRSLTVGDVVLPGIAIGFSDVLIFEELGLKNKPAVLLGMHDLRSFDRVAIDFSERKLLLDLPEGVLRPSKPLGPRSATRL